MKRCVVAFLLLGCFGLADAAVAVSESATMYMEKALKKRSKGDYYGAVSLLQMAVRVADRSSQRILAQFMLGDCLLATGKYREAKSVFEDALLNGARGEEEAEARFRIAQCYSHLGEAAKMESACHELIGKFQRSPYSELAKSLLQAGAARAAAPPIEPIAGAVDDENLDEAFRTKAQSSPDRIHIEPVSGMINQPSAAAGSPNAEPVRPEPKASSGTREPARQKSNLAATASRPGTKVVETTPEPESGPRSMRVPEPARREATPPSAPQSEPALPGERLLVFPGLSLQEKEALATSILKDQEILDPQRSDQDGLLLRLASQTALFGEPLEACKLYDKLLAGYPRSVHVEEAYFEAIRLRVILRAYDTALTWSDAFRKTFPKSRRLPLLEQLVQIARSRKGKAGATSSSGSAEALKDPRYREAKRKLDGKKYALALADFQALVGKYPDSPRLWHELAIVQYQLQKLPEAEESLGRLLALEPGEPIDNEARSLLGHIYYLQGKVQKAVDEYKAAGKNETAGLDYFNSESAALRIGKSRNGKQR